MFTNLYIRIIKLFGKKLSVHDQVKLTYSVCPDVWQETERNSCPRHYGMCEMNCIFDGVCDTSLCTECWDFALRENKIIKRGDSRDD